MNKLAAALNTIVATVWFSLFLYVLITGNEFVDAKGFLIASFSSFIAFGQLAFLGWKNAKS